jgi:hypothetical protein
MNRPTSRRDAEFVVTTRRTCGWWETVSTDELNTGTSRRRADKENGRQPSSSLP